MDLDALVIDVNGLDPKKAILATTQHPEMRGIDFYHKVELLLFHFQTANNQQQQTQVKLSVFVCLFLTLLMI